jgi:hypothetical protein
VKQHPFEEKTMFVLFLMTSKPLLIHALPSGATISAIYYRDQCLKILVKKLRKKRPASTTNGNVMAHPRYSPDLAPSDYWLFGTLKRRLVSYPDAASLAHVITKELHSIPIEEYQKTFQKWIERMKLGIQHRGDYFKHLM